MSKESFGILLYWFGWLFIPWVAEFLFAAKDLLYQYIQMRKSESKSAHPLTEYPNISIVIQMRSSASSLMACIDSIEKSLYPDRKIRILIIGDQSSRISQDVFDLASQCYPNLPMQWMDSRQGFNRAMNAAIYNAPGKYIVSLDSNGELHPLALRCMISEFEKDPSKNCIGGTLVTKPRVIRRSKSSSVKRMQVLEFMQSIHDSICSPDVISNRSALYTNTRRILGFRKTAVVANQEAEDLNFYYDNTMHVQMLAESFERIDLCKDALLYVDPVPGFKELYQKMKSWQAEIQQREWLRMRAHKPLMTFSGVMFRAILCDELHAMPKIIWYLSVIALMARAGLGLQIFLALMGLYLLYVLLEYMRSIQIRLQIGSLPEVIQYYLSKCYYIFLFPAFALLCSVLGIAGLLEDGSGFSQTAPKRAGEIIRQDLQRIRPLKRNHSKDSKTKEAVYDR